MSGWALYFFEDETTKGSDARVVVLDVCACVAINGVGRGGGNDGVVVGSSLCLFWFCSVVILCPYAVCVYGCVCRRLYYAARATVRARRAVPSAATATSRA